MEVELIEANPHYAYIRFPDGREESVALNHLAPCDTSTNSADEVSESQQQEPIATPNVDESQVVKKEPDREIVSHSDLQQSAEPEPNVLSHEIRPLRRSQQLQHPPD